MRLLLDFVLFGYWNVFGLVFLDLHWDTMGLSLSVEEFGVICALI